MMVAVLKEIKEKYPEARLIVNNNEDEAFIRSLYGGNFELRRSVFFYKVVSKFHLVRIAGLFSRRLALFLTEKNAIKGVDLCLNFGGFQFGDQWNHNHVNVSNWRDYLSKQHQYGTKIIFMSQAFGPFTKPGSRNVLKVLNDYADVLIARDIVSFEYLKKEGVKKEKVFLYPDFTVSVQAKETGYSRMYTGRVCVIPNSKIIQTGIMNKNAYIDANVRIIEHIYEKGKEVVLLNHEGIGDYKLCKLISEKFNQKLPIITNLNAIETKGVIASSYFVVSSRFHGVANALSSCVPCLATSWSHKYQLLLDEYQQGEFLLNLSNIDKVFEQIDKLMDKRENDKTRGILEKMNTEIRIRNQEMWDLIWEKV